MKKYLLSLLLLLCACVCMAQNAIVLTPQQANDRVSGYISEGNYGALGRELPALRESVVPCLLHLADALVAYYEGRHAESNALIDQLSQYEKELGAGVIASMHNIAYYNALALEDYAAAGEYLKVVAQCGDETQRQTIAYFQKWMDAMAKHKAVKIKPSKRDREFSIENCKVGDSSLIMAKVTAGRQSTDMIFDTGCCYANCITEEAAERLGVKVVLDELPVNGVAGNTYAKVGILPKMKIGDVVIKNASFFIMEKIVDDPAVEKMDAILGTHILRAMGEMQIDMNEGKVTIPAVRSQAPERCNLSSHTGNYGIEIAFRGVPMVAHLDTGAGLSHLSSRFYNQYRVDIESVAASRSKIRRSGVGGSEQVEVMSVPGLAFDIAGRTIVFNPINVYTNGAESAAWYGVMGADFLRSAGKVTLDLERMFLRIE
ncbi:MAG: clan AA aspartic protease [Alistipes sp.]|nr:clan AA aspartic protease [Alistipes sp.]